MDEQDGGSNVNSNEKPLTPVPANVVPVEETDHEKNTEKSSEPPSMEVFLEGNENEVITIVTAEESTGVDGGGGGDGEGEEGEEREEVYIYERNDIETAPTETTTEYVQVTESNCAFEETEDKDVNVDGMEEEVVEESGDGGEGVNEKKGETPMKNFKNVILEDWEVEVPHVVENHEENGNEKEVTESASENVKDEMTQSIFEKRLEALKCPNFVTKEEIVKILDDSAEKAIRPIVRGKDLFFSIELTKRLNQKLSLGKNKTNDGGEKHNENDSCNNNNTTLDDRQKIVEILEADEVRDWKSIPSKSDTRGPKENGNDMEISKAIRSMEEVDSKLNILKTPRRTPIRRLRTMDKELERTLALQQLREEFPCVRKRSKTTKKVNHVPFLASTDLEKAMTLPEVTTALKPGPPKRRPCYLPEDSPKSKPPNPDVTESDFEMTPNPIVKTYSVKRKSTDTENEIKTTLEAVAKALTESSKDTIESKPKKPKTVPKETKKKKIIIRKKRKLKLEKRINSELEKLLGDEGAVRMLYDTQHSEGGTPSQKKTKFRTTTGIKKDLVLKTKLVKNAVMRLSGVGADGVFLRGKRRPIYQPTATGQEDEPLFSSTPNIVLYKPKKKQRAEASRILYRHSSSESFDSSEGYRRASFEADGLNTKPTEESKPTIDKPQSKGKQKKTEIDKTKPKKKKKKKGEEEEEEGGRGGGESLERFSTDSTSRLTLSNVPVRKSSRPRMVSKKYSIWSSTSMDSLSVESLGFKKLKKASMELGKKLNCKELTIMQYEHLVQVVLTPTTTTLKNSFNHEVLQELIQVLKHLAEEESCRVVLFTSRGSTFCQGIDIKKIISFSEGERKKEVSQLIKSIREFILCLSNFEKPILAGVQGAAVGLGVTLLPYCDLIISSDTASFYTPYVKLGQAPEGAPIKTFPLINRQLVSELLFKSHKMTAGDALKFGLITQVIPEERFEEDLIIISRNMASYSVQGMQSIKYLLRRTERRDITESLDAEGELLEKHWNSSECVNNMIKFLNSGELQLKLDTK